MTKENEQFEDLFKESFESFEAEVSPSVWKNVQTGLKGAGIGFLIKTAINKLGANAMVAIVSSTATVLTTMIIMYWTGNNNPKTAVNTKPVAKTVVVQKPEPVKLDEIKNFLKTEKPETTPAPAVADKPAVQNNDSPLKKDSKKIQSVINSFSDQSVAAISASTIGGTVPLIVNLNNNGTGKINRWDFGDGKKENSVNPVHVYDTPGIYTVYLSSTGADGKTATDSVRIEVMGNSSISNIPNSFSPNGDGVNDVFVFQSKNIVNMDAVIFDKKGNIFYTQNGIDGKWDGRDQKGNPAKAGVYYFIINAEGVDGKKYEQKGQINLTR